MSLPEQLRFQIGLIDQISKPLGNIQRQFSDLGQSYRDGTHTMVAGAAGVAGAGYAIQQALMPAIEMDRVLGEVKSLGVVDEQLQQLSDTALNFSVEYGKSATEFVAASYDIQSAISGLVGNELAEFTRASGVLAAATKADTGTITNYVGTMYGIFQNSANAMGKADWVNMLGGQTAQAVQMFKTTGDQMSAAFTSVGAAATSVGVGMSEQMAILGTLQSTMSGSEAGTKYRAFLAGAAKAQDALNMSFTDTQGQLLPIIDILNQLKGRYGETISVAEGAELSKAFGTQEATAMVQLLMQNTNGLADSIEALGNVKGLDVAEQMAGAMTDQWERLEQGVFAVRAAFGQALLPAVLPVVEMFANGAKEVLLWTKMFPNLTKYIGFAAMGVLGLTAAGGALTAMVGVAKMAFSTLMLFMSPLTGTVALIGAGIAAAALLIYEFWDPIEAFFTGFWDGLTSGFNLMFGLSDQSSETFGGLLDVFQLLWSAMKAFWNSTIGLFADLLSMQGGLNAFMDLGELFGTTLGNSLMLIVEAIKLVGATFTAVITGITGLWQFALSGFSDTSVFAPFIAATDAFGKAFWGIVGTLWKQITDIINFVIKQVNLIPGIEIDLIGEMPEIKSEAVQKATPRNEIKPGEAAKSIANYAGNQTHYGGIAIYPASMSSPQDLAEELEFAAG